MHAYRHHGSRRFVVVKQIIIIFPSVVWRYGTVSPYIHARRNFNFGGCAKPPKFPAIRYTRAVHAEGKTQGNSLTHAVTRRRIQIIYAGLAVGN